MVVPSRPQQCCRPGIWPRRIHLGTWISRGCDPLGPILARSHLLGEGVRFSEPPLQLWEGIEVAVEAALERCVGHRPQVCKPEPPIQQRVVAPVLVLLDAHVAARAPGAPRPSGREANAARNASTELPRRVSRTWVFPRWRTALTAAGPLGCRDQGGKAQRSEIEASMAVR